MESIKRSSKTARNACVSCRSGKRRCDKTLPSCQLCVKKGADCVYPKHRPGNQRPEWAVASQSSTTLSSVSSLLTNNVAISFLAPHILLDAHFELPRPNIPVPDEVIALIGETSSIRDMSLLFFDTIYTWMPVISRKRFFSHLLNPLSRRQTELSLLAICMKLSCTSPEKDSASLTLLYQTAKQFHSEVEGSGLISIHVLQAAILIAIFEISQAIYPAAYLTVGACARYGIALGIDKLGLELSKVDNQTRPWIEIEEMRRVWWAVLILDRFMNMSNPHRHLATEDPTFDYYLPVDTENWDNDVSRPEDAVNISTAFALKMGLFSRLAQSVFLLGQALRILTSTSEEKSSLQSETTQLRRTLIALVHAADREATVRQLEFCAQSTVCYSAILLLDGRNSTLAHTSVHGVDEDSARVLSVESTSAVGRLAGLASSTFRKDCIENPSITDKISIFLIQATYQAASALISMSRGTPDNATRQSIDSIKLLLGTLNERWRLAGVYQGILEVEATMATLKMP